MRWAPWDHQSRVFHPQAGCAINLFGSRVTSVILQTQSAPRGQQHYLATSFHAGDRTNGTSQALWFIGDVDTFSHPSPQWNTYFLDSPNNWFGNPTIAMDPDLDIAMSETTFRLGSSILASWYMFRGFSNNSTAFPSMLGSGPLAGA